MAKFKVGDKVIRTEDVWEHFPDNCLTGNVVEVAVIGQSKVWNGWLIFDGSVGSFNPARFSLAPKQVKKWLKATPESIAELKVGDKVKLSSSENATVLTNEKLGNAPIKLSNGGWYCLTGVLFGQVNSGIDIVKIRNKEYVKENANKSS